MARGDTGGAKGDTGDPEVTQGSQRWHKVSRGEPEVAPVVALGGVPKVPQGCKVAWGGPGVPGVTQGTQG